MPQFKVHCPNSFAKTIQADNLEHAGRIANKKYPLWEDIYKVKQTNAERSDSRATRSADKEASEI